MLSPAQAQAEYRGQELKRHIRAAAALRGLYDDTALAEEVGVNRGAVAGWWTGARMQPETISRVADATGLSFEELTAFLYRDGPPPTLPNPALLPVQEGIRRDQERQATEVPDAPSRQPEQRPRGSGAGHA